MNPDSLTPIAEKAANRASLYRLTGNAALAAEWSAVARGLYDAIAAMEAAKRMESDSR